MIEITSGTIEERIIRLLKKKYPITVDKIKSELKISKNIIERILKKFQLKGVVKLEPLPGKTYVRLLRQDFSFVGKKRQHKFKKHKTEKKKKTKEYDGIMYQ